MSPRAAAGSITTSDLEYVPFRVSITDVKTGEVREWDFNFSTLTNAKAAELERQGGYFMALLRQWNRFLGQVNEKAADSNAYAFKRRMKMED